MTFYKISDYAEQAEQKNLFTNPDFGGINSLGRSTQRNRSSNYPLLGLKFTWLGT